MQRSSNHAYKQWRCPAPCCSIGRAPHIPPHIDLLCHTPRDARLSAGPALHRGGVGALHCVADQQHPWSTQQHACTGCSNCAASNSTGASVRVAGRMRHQVCAYVCAIDACWSVLTLVSAASSPRVRSLILCPHSQRFHRRPPSPTLPPHHHTTALCRSSRSCQWCSTS